MVSSHASASSFTQICAMIWIRFLQTIRDKKFLFTGLLIPFIVVAISIILNESLRFTIPPTTSTTETALPINSSIALIPTNTNQKNVSLFLNELKSIYNLDYIEFDTPTELDNAILNQTSNLNFGIEFQQANPQESLLNFNPTLYYNQSTILPQLTKSVFVALYKLLTNKDLQISETSIIISSIESFDLFPKIAPLLIQYGYIFILPYFAILLVVDRDKGIKNHLYLNSLRNTVYWGSQFFADYLIYLIPAIIGWSALAIAKVDGIYNNGNSLLLFLTFGFSAIPFGFILQFIFSKEETANKWLYPIISIASSVPTVLSSFVSKDGITFETAAPLSIFPSYSLYSGLYFFIQQQSKEGNYIILIQILSGLFYCAIIYLIEKFNKPTTNKIEDIENRKLNVSGDQDVVTERNKILNGQLNKDNQYILIDGVFKQFIEDIPVSMGEDRKKSIKNAVDGIYLGVEKGETFGLLGVNGAGKTTLLNIMTGILQADEGDGFIRGHSISKNPREAFSSVSSCPQFDILFDNLTLFEHLKFFAWIKGVPSNTRKTAAEYFINKFNIQEHKDKKSKDLSGGTKRKLSVACSLIGGSSIIFMDELSSNLDPTSRRELWSLISELKADKAIILTTHSIEEADFLCNRVGIMVNGKLRCLGTPLHLKHKYGSGYQLDIVPVDYSINRPQIESFIRETYPLAKPIDRIGTTLSFEVPTEQITLSHIFKQIELKKFEIGIKDFSLSQSSLEKVFLKLANEQSSNDEQDPNIKIQNRPSIFNLFKK